MYEVVGEGSTPRFYVPRQRDYLALLVDVSGAVDEVDTALATKSLSKVIKGKGVEKLVGFL